MDSAGKKRVEVLKDSILDFLNTGNGRHYEDKTRNEQAIENLAQSLYTRLDQHLRNEGLDLPSDLTPEEQLSNRLVESAVNLKQGGRVGKEMADEFTQVLETLDDAADLTRRGETMAIKLKRKR